MNITDSQGKVINITNLEASIAVVEEFMSYQHENADEGLKRFDEQRKAYWTDIHQKLMLLKNEQTNENN